MAIKRFTLAAVENTRWGPTADTGTVKRQNDSVLERSNNGGGDEAKFRTKLLEEERGTEGYIRNNLRIRIYMMSHDIMMH